jgi:hypothetical protein
MKMEFPVMAHYKYDGHRKDKIERYWQRRRLEMMNPIHLNREWVQAIIYHT